MYMLDTNIASYIIKKKYPKLNKRILTIPMSALCISAITEAELLFGLARKPQATQLKTIVYEFLLRVDILPWDSLVAQQYAKTRAELESKGKVIGNFDMMIASHALSTKATLISNDKAFKMIHELDIEDWTK